MAAPCTHVSKLGKLVCEFSSFTNEKSRHRKVVEEHYFNYAVSSNTLSCFDFLFHVSVFPFSAFYAILLTITTQQIRRYLRV